MGRPHRRRAQAVRGLGDKAARGRERKPRRDRRLCYPAGCGAGRLRPFSRPLSLSCALLTSPLDAPSLSPSLPLSLSLSASRPRVTLRRPLPCRGLHAVASMYVFANLRSPPRACLDVDRVSPSADTALAATCDLLFPIPKIFTRHASGKYSMLCMAPIMHKAVARLKAAENGKSRPHGESLWWLVLVCAS